MSKVGTDKMDKIILSRREFLKEAGIVAGGVAIASMALSSACNATETNTTAPELTLPQTSQSTTPTESTTDSATVSTTPLASTTVNPQTTTAGTTGSSSTGGTTAIQGNSNLLAIPGCNTKVAADRLYDAEYNIWVKSMGSNVVQLGLSDQAQYLADKVNTCSLSPIGATLQREQGFGAIEADKMSFDLISPVSGKIVATNTSLTAIPGPINSDAYGSGWMVNVALSKPSELDSLVSPAYYVYLESGKTGTAPPKR